MRASRLPAKMISALALGLALSACTTTRVGTDRLAEKDPLEGFNRTIWAVNRGADKVVVKPVTQVYRAVAPKPARDGVRNFFANVGEPFSFINNVLQGKPDRAVRNLGRFLINTTVGIGGLFDQASRVGVRPATEDFGQTLAVWGANGGPYLVLPLLGPSTLRDGLIEAGADGFLESSLDPYAAARSAFLQRRRAEILNQDGDDAAAEAAAAADAEANPITDDGLGAADTDAGIPGTDTAPSPDATPAPNASETAAEPGNPASSEETKQPN